MKKGKPYKVVVTAVMRKLIVILSAMLKAVKFGNTQNCLKIDTVDCFRPRCARRRDDLCLYFNVIRFSCDLSSP